jgi:hypothetical protein
MGMAFYYVDNDTTKWRGPLGLALIFPFMMLAILPFVPESPRFLLMKGKVEKAQEVVLRLHALPGDEDNEFARAEFYQMHKQAEFDRTLSVSWVSTGCRATLFGAKRRLREGRSACSQRRRTESEQPLPLGLPLSVNRLGKFSFSHMPHSTT